jgi:hypothetical protein
MAYNPGSTDREHHLAALTSARQWYRIADICRNAFSIPPEKADISLGHFLALVGQRTRLSTNDLMRMIATLDRVERYAEGARVDKFLSDDLDAVEAATRIAWHDMARGRQLLRDLKHGEVSKQGVFALLETMEKIRMSVPKPAAKTPHANWSHYDEHLEMLEFDRLHAILAHGDTVQTPDYDRLVRLAHSAGYADADSFITARGLDPSDDDGLAAAEREQFEGYMDADYWNQIDRSQNVLQAIGTENAREAAQAICQAMRDAYEKGRTLRIERAAQPAPTP